MTGKRHGSGGSPTIELLAFVVVVVFVVIVVVFVSCGGGAWFVESGGGGSDGVHVRIVEMESNGQQKANHDTNHLERKHIFAVM